MTLSQRKVHFDSDERGLMIRVLVEGLKFPQTAESRGTTSAPWWYVLRIALALSLKSQDLPDEEFGRSSSSKAEPRLEQVIGVNPIGPDLTNVFQALISAHQGEDLFSDEDRFVELLQRHLRRGLAEIKAGWRKGNDFFDFLQKEFLADPMVSRSGSDVGPENVIRVLNDHNVSCELEGQAEGPRLTVLTLKLGSSGDLGRMRRVIDLLPFELGTGHGATYELASGQRRISLFLPRPPSLWATVDSHIGLQALKKSKAILPVSPGVTVAGEPYTFDLTEAPHLFVAGQTGAGKSVCMHAIVRSLIEAKEPNLLALIDPKEVEFRRYRDDERVDLYRDGIVTNAHDGHLLLGKLIEEMTNRQSALAKMKVTNLAEARKKGATLPYIVLVVDELADLILTAEETVDQLILLSQKSRAVGIHLVLATQRPDAETFPGLLRSNIPSRIALAVRSATDSRIILDEPGGEKLLGRGDMLVKLAGQPTTRLHGFNFDD